MADGDEVAAGQVLAIVEAMKMENPLRAPHAGQVTALRGSVGDTVAQGRRALPRPSSVIPSSNTIIMGNKF